MGLSTVALAWGEARYRLVRYRSVRVQPDSGQGEVRPRVRAPTPRQSEGSGPQRAACTAPGSPVLNHLPASVARPGLGRHASQVQGALAHPQCPSQVAGSVVPVFRLLMRAGNCLSIRLRVERGLVKVAPAVQPKVGGVRVGLSCRKPLE